MSSDEKTILPMPFNGTVFFEAVQMFDDDTRCKYLRALWFYWWHTHCDGIPNDDEGMRELCRCDLSRWARVKGLIFDNDKFFCLDNGKWHQKRCKATYEKHLELMKKRQQLTEPARKAAIVSRSVIDIDTDKAWIEDLKSNPAYAGLDVEIELGKMTAWCLANRKMASRRRFINWLNRAEKPMTVHVPFNGREVSPSVAMMTNQTALNRVEDRLKFLKGQFPLTDDKLKSEWAELKTERTRLMAALNFKA